MWYTIISSNDNMNNMKVDNQQLYNELHKYNILPTNELVELFTYAQKENVQLGELLVKNGKIKEDRLIEIKAKMLGFPYVDMEKMNILEDTLNIIPEKIAKKFRIIAFKKQGKTLHVAMLNPEDLQTLDFLRKKTNLIIVPYATSRSSMSIALRNYEQTIKAEFSDIISENEENEDLEKIAADLPIVRIVETLIKHAILQGASDIHIEPLEKEVVVRFRVDGMLRVAMKLPKNTQAGIVARIKVLSRLKLDEHRLPQDGRFKMVTDDYKISFRVSILPVFDGEKIVMRLLKEDSSGLTLEKMGLHGEALEAIHRDIHKPNGMILVTGPTGSGKTTTLYTVVDILNDPSVNISTIEDPIEYRMDSINQTQVHAKIGMTFEAGLRSLLRQDPDIIMVGEIRDMETLEIAMHAAMTGHLLLSTLHTNSAAGAISRMIDMGAQAFLIASTTNVIIGQRLVRKLCNECKQVYRLDEKMIETLEKSFDLELTKRALIYLKAMKQEQSLMDFDIYKAVGCDECGGLGYKGRSGIFEVFEVTEGIEKLITQNATADELERFAREENNMVTLVDDGFYKVLQGITTIEEVMRVTKE